MRIRHYSVAIVLATVGWLNACDGGQSPEGADSAAVDGGTLTDVADSDEVRDSTYGDTIVTEAADGSDAALDAADGFDGFVCDENNSPHDDPCVVANAYGVFVSPQGHDGAVGTMSDPLRSVAEGIAKATQTGKSHVYVCDGSYAEQVTLSAAVSLYGGLSCTGDAGWTYADGGMAQVTGPQNQVALTVTGITTPIAIEDFLVVAASAAGLDDAGNGLSSIAVLVNGSTVAFRRCTFGAGSADNGGAGVAGNNYVFFVAPDGGANEGGLGGLGGRVTCVDGTNAIGGSGGNVTSVPPEGDGGAGISVPAAATSPGRDGLGGAGDDGINGCARGHNGANGAATDGGGAASSYGALNSMGWLPSPGSAGQPGSPGQGGGGGGANSAPLLGGTGGGAGGCGGAGGTGGGGGGASIALASITSRVTMEGCALTTSAAGNGGKGGDGQPGQGGGTYGAALGPCLGGFGGNGAGGAAGGGGTGGISVCTAYKGTQPTASLSCAIGTGGSPGNGGAGGDGGTNPIGNGLAGPNGADGHAGLSQQSLQVP